jgi:putative transposase
MPEDSVGRGIPSSWVPMSARNEYTLSSRGMSSALPVSTMHKGVHDRGYLPHWDFADSVQAINFRLGDSLPSDVVAEWRRELKAWLKSPDTAMSLKGQAELHRRIARYEDAGHGSCVLAKPELARIVQESLLEGHGIAYKLIAWCIMPNHVHAVIRLLDETSLGVIVKRWKAGAAIRINRELNRSGSLWQEDYHDRLIRDMDHLENAVVYIRQNPVKAGLCGRAEDWTFGCAGQNWCPELEQSVDRPLIGRSVLRESEGRAE